MLRTVFSILELWTTLHSKNSVFASMTRSTDNCRASYESLLVPDTVVSGTVIAKIYFKK
jgi:hypothetical protein